ncbi:Furin [Plecturocebus cupreus]
MQHLVVQTSKPAHLNANDWATNGMGRKNWTTVVPQQKCIIDNLTEPKDIGKRLEVRKTVTACLGEPNHITWLEHTQVRLSLSFNHRGNLAIHLVSPMGTRSTLWQPDGFNDWAFMTTHSWDEDPSGEWILEIENTSAANNYGTLTKFSRMLYGAAPEGLPIPPESSSCKTLTSS